MTAFNFFETILLVSLAITFVLIMFLVYHFKQRITITEEKTDTMFDIINNMAKEMTNIRTTMNMVVQPTIQIPRVPSYNKIDVSDGSDDESESGSDEDDSGDENDGGESENDGDESESDGDGDESENDGDASDEATCDTEDEEIKLISMNLDNDIDNTINSDDVIIDDNVIDEKDHPPTELNDNNLVVEKLNVIDSYGDTESLDEKTYSHSNYRKMNLLRLRELMISRGFSIDTSKMKKNDIISLLENNE